MYTQQDISQLVNKCKSNLDLNKPDPNLSFPKSLPICILEAVFSMNVRNKSSNNVWKRYMEYYGILADPNTGICKPEHTINDFINNANSFHSVDDFIDNVLKNRQRTSPTNGMLKAEAAIQVAKAFQNNGFNSLNDFNNTNYSHSQLDADICMVKGQSSGIMLKYLYMLAGSTNTCKPDRMLQKFIKSDNPHIEGNDIQSIMTDLVKLLNPKYPNLSVRGLDYLIWDYQRQQ